jgi:GNAT superfamily N-acetyltransferase
MKMHRSELSVRLLRADERPWLQDQLTRAWGSCTIVNRRRVHDASRLPALVCDTRDQPLGFATFLIEARQCELVTINALCEHRGAGSALLSAVAAQATRQGCDRLWLVTTNDNLQALRFYQRRDMRLVAVHRGAADHARALKPSIPHIGHFEIPIHDELELELPLR